MSSVQSIPKELDLRWQKTNYSAFFSEEEFESLIDDFSTNIERCNRAFDQNLDWHFEPISARNNFASPLFHHFCCARLCMKMARSGKCPTVTLTDCDHLFRGLQDLKKSGRWHGRISHVRKRSVPSMFLKRARTLFRVASGCLIPYVLIRFFLKQKSSSLCQTLVDTYVLPHKELSDPYYRGVFDYLKPEEKKVVNFVPTFQDYSISDYPRAIRTLENSERNFLFKESSLYFSDYFFALRHSLRVFFLKPPRIPIGVFNLGHFIREEIRRFGGLADAVNGFLNFSFAKRLSEKKLSIGHLLNWYENQGTDRGWNLGFRQHFPEAKKFAYFTGTADRYHLSLSPLPSESLAGLQPDCLFTPILHFISQYRMWDSSLVAKKTGSFRFPTIPLPQNTPRNRLQVFVPLPFDHALCEHLIKRIRVFSESTRENLFWSIKSHPATSSKNLKEHIDAFSKEKFRWSNASLEDEFSNCDFVLSCWTSCIMEAVEIGIPTGVLRGPDGLFHSPIPPGIADQLQVEIDCVESFKDLLKVVRENSLEKTSSSLLEPPSRSHALKLLNLYSPQAA